jgi:hypothetical protein
MEEFINNLSSPSWWIGVVVIGILLNLLSDYLRQSLDKGSSRISRWWANRSEQSRRKRNEQLDVLRSDKQEQILLSTKEIVYRLQSIFFVTLCILAFVLKEAYFPFLPSAVNMVFGLILLIGLSCHWDAMRARSLLAEARNEKF